MVVCYWLLYELNELLAADIVRKPCNKPLLYLYSNNEAVHHRHIWVRLCVCETPCRASGVLIERANWWANYFNGYPSSPHGGRCNIFCVSLHVQAKHRRHGAWFHKHKKEQAIQYIHILVNSIQMDIFHINSRRWALYFPQRGRMSYLVRGWSPCTVSLLYS